MEVFRIDATGLRCPQPVLKLAMDTVNIAKGTVVQIDGDCPTFEADIRAWCDRRGRAVLSVRPLAGEAKAIQIQF
jgi:tRNA 2-thiouridine synthesizing protein A